MFKKIKYTVKVNSEIEGQHIFATIHNLCIDKLMKHTFYFIYFLTCIFLLITYDKIANILIYFSVQLESWL